MIGLAGDPGIRGLFGRRFAAGVKLAFPVQKMPNSRLLARRQVVTVGCIGLEAAIRHQNQDRRLRDDRQRLV